MNLDEISKFLKKKEELDKFQMDQFRNGMHMIGDEITKLPQTGQSLP